MNHPDLSATHHLEINGCKIVINQPDPVQMADSLLLLGRYDELIAFCEGYLENHRYHFHFWSLLGFGYGNKRDFNRARQCFMEALLVNPGHALTVANFITACLQGGDSVTAFQGIERFYNGLDAHGRKTVAESLLQAKRQGLFTKDETPKPIWELLERSGRVPPVTQCDSYGVHSRY